MPAPLQIGPLLIFVARFLPSMFDPHSFTHFTYCYALCSYSNSLGTSHHLPYHAFLLYYVRFVLKVPIWHYRSLSSPDSVLWYWIIYTFDLSITSGSLLLLSHPSSFICMKSNFVYTYLTNTSWLCTCKESNLTISVVMLQGHFASP